MKAASRPLLRRSDLLPGESLPSLLGRLAELNGYAPASIVWKLCLCGVKDSLDRPSKASTLEQIAILTGLAPTSLCHASLHALARVLVPPEVQTESFRLSDGNSGPLLPSMISAPHVRTAAAAFFCPSCLRETVYHRLMWTPGAVSTCLRHQQLLVGCCPACAKQITLGDIVQATCRHCGVDLRDAPSTDLSQDKLEIRAQETIQAWFSGSVRSDHPGLEPLAEYPIASLYRLLYGLVQSTARTKLDWTYRHQLASGMTMAAIAGSKATLMPYQSYVLYTTAFKALIDWPYGFWSFLDALRVRSGEQSRGLNAELGTVYSTWLQTSWLHPSLAFVQRAFETYLARNYVASSLARSGRRKATLVRESEFVYVSGAEAARLLGTTAKVIGRLTQLGILKTSAENRVPTQLRFRRLDVLALLQTWTESVCLSEAALYLGLSEDIVVKLAKAGVLRSSRGPMSDGSQRWMFDRSHLFVLFETFDTHKANQITDEHDEVSLATAARMLFPIGLNSAAIIQEVINGNLHLTYLDDASRTKPVLSRTEVTAFLVWSLAQRRWINRTEVAKMLGVKHTIVARWIRHGILRPVATIAHMQHFDKDSIEKFAAEHVSTTQAAKLLGVRTLTVQKWARKGRLIPVSGPGIDGCHCYLFRRVKCRP